VPSDSKLATSGARQIIHIGEISVSFNTNATTDCERFNSSNAELDVELFFLLNLAATCVVATYEIYTTRPCHRRTCPPNLARPNRHHCFAYGFRRRTHVISRL
jgi:hypothetical protein